MEVSVKQLKKETDPTSVQVGDTLIPTAGTIPQEEKPLIEAITQGNIVGEEENLKKRKQAISAKGFEPVEFAYERAIGRNDSLYSNFAELIAITKRKVGRIVVIEDGRKTGYGTGFMVSPRLLLTNWHVFRNKGMADESEVHFFYEYDSQGYPQTPAIFKFDVSGFFSNQALDYCFIAVRPMDITGKIPLQSIGYLYLDKTLGKLGSAEQEKLNIIHHPLGDYKQISIRENTFAGIEETKIFYVTDTAPGSSGSPVFNDQWQVVGLHHKSVAKMSLDGEHYLDKDDIVIPVINGKIEASRIVWVKNEGMRISVILKHVIRKFPSNDLIAGLAVPPPSENLTFGVNNNNNTISAETKVEHIVSDTSRGSINISVPVNTLSADHAIQISISSKGVKTDNSPTTKTQSTAPADEFLLEIAKATQEQEMDFSSCRGYDPMFLGVPIPLPQPKRAIRKQIARLKNNEIELKYFKHSVIFNAVTKMPLISAVNVEGDSSKRLDNSKRSDDWLRDARIDSECQLTDKFYSKSNFDKGHMSRFEDANWDDSEEAALRNGIYTCFYTNACPQVVGLNRAGGLWGKLEKTLLEKGVKQETDRREARMTVFNGPIFNDEKDRIFKGVKIPMEFYKVIVWLNDEGRPRATAFKLSQETLVDDIKFDESMRLDAEALDIDKDVVFKNYQCSLKHLGKLTKIDFKALERFDTFVANEDEECFIDRLESIVL